MKLILSNGYPLPFPASASDAEQERISMAAPGIVLVVNAVAGFEWKYTLTVEFHFTPEGRTSYDRMLGFGWRRWSDPVLEAQISEPDGYGHPALLVGTTAYCGLLITG